MIATSKTRFLNLWDQIVMDSRRPGMVQGLLPGSVSGSVLQHAAIPVLIVH